jgi:hypothetical protein
MVALMLKYVIEQLAQLFGPDPGRHAGDDSHAIDDDNDEDWVW